MAPRTARRTAGVPATTLVHASSPVSPALDPPSGLDAAWAATAGAPAARTAHGSGRAGRVCLGSGGASAGSGAAGGPCGRPWTPTGRGIGVRRGAGHGRLRRARPPPRRASVAADAHTWARVPSRVRVGSGAPPGEALSGAGGAVGRGVGRGERATVSGRPPASARVVWWRRPDGAAGDAVPPERGVRGARVAAAAWVQPSGRARQGMAGWGIPGPPGRQRPGRRPIAAIGQTAVLPVR